MITKSYQNLIYFIYQVTSPAFSIVIKRAPNAVKSFWVPPTPYGVGPSQKPAASRPDLTAARFDFLIFKQEKERKKKLS